MAEKWVRLDKDLRADMKFTCTCGEENEVDMNGPELDGSTSVEFSCDGCDGRLLIYADLDVRVKVKEEES